MTTVVMKSGVKLRVLPDYNVVQSKINEARGDDARRFFDTIVGPEKKAGKTARKISIDTTEIAVVIEGKS